MTAATRRRGPASTEGATGRERRHRAPLRRRRFAVHGGGPQAVSAARHQVNAITLGWGLADPDRWTVESVAAEILANAVDHAPGITLVGISLAPDGLGVAVQVHDSSRTAPGRPANYGNDEDVDGRGMLIVDSLAARWGHRLSAHGKCVWAEIVISPVPASPTTRALRRASLLVEAVRAGRRRALR